MGVRGGTGKPPAWWEYLLLLIGLLAFGWLIANGVGNAARMWLEIQKKERPTPPSVRLAQ